MLAAGGCGTTEREGEVGDTLESRTLHATLEKAKQVGSHYAVQVRLCRDEPGPAVNSFAFTLVLADDTEVRPDPLQTGFSVSRDGCETGVIAYSVARGRDVGQLRFDYDDTGSAQPGDREEHATFTWDLTSG